MSGSDPDFVKAERAARRAQGRVRSTAALPAAVDAGAPARLTRGPRGWFLAGERLHTGELVEVWTNPHGGWVRGRLRVQHDGVELIVVLSNSDSTDLDPRATVGALTGTVPAGTRMRRT